MAGRRWYRRNRIAGGCIDETRRIGAHQTRVGGVRVAAGTVRLDDTVERVIAISDDEVRRAGSLKKKIARLGRAMKERITGNARIRKTAHAN